MFHGCRHQIAHLRRTRPRGSEEAHGPTVLSPRDLGEDGPLRTVAEIVVLESEAEGVAEMR